MKDYVIYYNEHRLLYIPIRIEKGEKVKGGLFDSKNDNKVYARLHATICRLLISGLASSVIERHFEEIGLYDNHHEMYIKLIEWHKQQKRPPSL